MNRENITISMPIVEYEDLIDIKDFWQNRYNNLKRVILKHAEHKENYYEVKYCPELAADIEDFLNSEE